MKGLLIILLLVIITSYGQSQIRIIYVEPSTNTIRIKNFGASTVDISAYRLCSLIKYTSNLTTGITVNSGSLNLAAGAEVEIVAPGGASSSWQNLQSEADLGLYLASGSFGSTSAMVDFVQWGSGGHGRESVANTKGIWTAGEFVGDDEPYSYIGNGSENGASFWEGTVVTNNAPTNITLSDNTIDENGSAGDVVGTLTTTDADPDSHTYTLVSGTGDTDNVQFQIVNDELQSGATFNFESKNSYSVRIQTDDGNGGTFQKAFSISVNDLNDDPTNISLDNNTIDENVASGTVVGNLTTTDEDNTDSHTYTLVTGTGDEDNAQFQIVNNEFQTNTIFNFESKSTYSVRVQTDDGNGGTFQSTFSITVNDLNDDPTDIILDNQTLNENESVGSLVGNLSTTDEDSGDSHIYSLVAGAGDTDNSQFVINTNSLESNVVFDFETKSTYSVRVRTDDGNGGLLEEIFEISVNDVNDSPADLSLNNNIIPEGQPIGTTIGTFSTTDQDADTHTYNFVSGTGDTDNASFTISGDKLKSNEVFDFANKSSYSIRVATSDGIATFEKSFTISVTSVNDNVPPVDIILSSNTVDENEASQTLVGSFTTADPNTNDNHTYTFVTGSNDNTNFQISDNQLLTAEIFNFESKSSYSIQVETNDGNGGTFQKSFHITIVDQNDDPEDIFLSNKSVNENQDTGTVIGLISTTDEDSADTHTYSLTNNSESDNNLFTINGDQLQTNDIFNFEIKSQYNIEIEVTDNQNGAFIKTFMIAIIDVNDAPADIFLSENSVLTGSPTGTLVGNFSIEDEDAGDSHTFSLVSGTGGADNDSFTISGMQLLTSAIFDINTTSPLNILVSVNDGSASLEKSFEINIEAIASADHQHESKVQVYPNPFTDALFINTGTINISDIGLYSLVGHKLININKQSHREGQVKIEMSAIPAGIYLLSILSDNARSVYLIRKD